jgi:hypothetical protein
MMTRKDCVKTAEILKKHFESNPQLTQEVFEDLVDEFSLMFEEDNERFDSDKFLEACLPDLDL